MKRMPNFMSNCSQVHFAIISFVVNINGNKSYEMAETNDILRIEFDDKLQTSKFVIILKLKTSNVLSSRQLSSSFCHYPLLNDLLFKIIKKYNASVNNKYLFQLLFYSEVYLCKQNSFLFLFKFNLSHESFTIFWTAYV